MITWGFVVSYSDAVTIGQPFLATVNGNKLPLTATYIGVETSGGSGDIVWLNALGIPQWLPNCQAGQFYPIGASQIVASGVVNGVSRTTTATDLIWLASPSATS
jgi:hypothetical protein